MVVKFDIGSTAKFSKTISEFDVYQFAGISGDLNPIHINKIAGEASIFKDRVAHGMLVSSLISTTIGMKLPGEGTIYLGQNLKFTRPVYIGDTVTAKVEVAEFIKKDIVKLLTTVTNQHGKTVVEGDAVVKVPIEE
ncbi:MaoC family dehydratase [Kurthia huakuii]|uniref:MaoC family dehydratase n=1 Tax=Kurthia huakuii TaxID=1421019 RepID=UPI0004AFD32B|nr:MaoC family dehydratase [Kurthia huakuii]MBM7700981.1 3-hydroxybutyryl-CoA dehydratase [Kurthia huakuii]